MISNQVIQTSIEELKEITRIDFCVVELDGTPIASTYQAEDLRPTGIRSFIDSQADSQVMQDCHMFRVMDEDVTVYVLVAKGTDEKTDLVGRIAVSNLQNLITAYKERLDRNSFFQNLILDNMLLVDIYNRAKKLRIPVDAKRVVYVIEPVVQKDFGGVEMVRTVFSGTGSFVTAVDEKSIILIRTLEEDEDRDSLMRTAEMLVDTMHTEAMVRVRISYGSVVSEIRQVSQSFKEAQMALEVGKIFYEEREIIPYATLGIGRLIYQLQPSLCDQFLREIFENEIPDHLDEETLTTINKFFENNLNVSETSRQLFVHRNTLVYRIEKLQKATGLDLRNFDDALTFKIALMVVNYMKHIRSEDRL